MSLSRRHFLADASALGMLTAILPQLAAQTSTSEGLHQPRICLTTPTTFGTVFSIP